MTAARSLLPAVDLAAASRSKSSWSSAIVAGDVARRGRAVRRNADAAAPAHHVARRGRALRGVAERDQHRRPAVAVPRLHVGRRAASGSAVRPSSTNFRPGAALASATACWIICDAVRRQVGRRG